jgi:predicted heme/steroid binding protein
MSSRQRPPRTSKPLPPNPSAPPPPPKPPSKSKPKSASLITPLDVLRTLTGLLLLNSALSYFLTGTSFLWGHPRPWYLRPHRIAHYLRGPLLLTDAQLSLYNGSDPALPILLAINGTIYDVSAGARTYGPGGGYSFFSGKDGARAFVTGCFGEEGELCWDLRGVEGMYVPIDDEEEHAEGLSRGEKKMRRERELREGKKEVARQIKHWRDFFREGNTKGYFEVGRVVGRKGVEETFGPVRELCEGAKGARPKRKKGGGGLEEGKRAGDRGQKGEKPV